MQKFKKQYPFIVFMREKGIKNQKRLADLCGVSEVMVHYLVTGKKEPSARMVNLLCRALRCKPMELMEKLKGPGR